MALVASALENDLARILGYPKIQPVAARELAAAYATYVNTATAGVSRPNFLGSESNALSVTLLEAINDPQSGMPVKFARAWADGVQNYWLTLPMAWSGGSGAGVTTAFLGYASLLSNLTTLFANTTNTPRVCAHGLARELDTATKTVVATLTLPGLSPVLYTVL